MLVEHGDWVELGAADEQKPAKDGTVEAWAREESNPVGGWYGLRKGYRGRFGMYLPPLLEHLGLVELEHHPAQQSRPRQVAPRQEGLELCVELVKGNSIEVHLLSTLGPRHSVLDGYPEIGSEGESLTTPSESVVSGPKPQ